MQKYPDFPRWICAINACNLFISLYYVLDYITLLFLNYIILRGKLVSSPYDQIHLTYNHSHRATTDLSFLKKLNLKLILNYFSN